MHIPGVMPLFRVSPLPTLLIWTQRHAIIYWLMSKSINYFDRLNVKKIVNWLLLWKHPKTRRFPRKKTPPQTQCWLISDCRTGIFSEGVFPNHWFHGTTTHAVVHQLRTLGASTEDLCVSLSAEFTFIGIDKDSTSANFENSPIPKTQLRDPGVKRFYMQRALIVKARHGAVTVSASR